MTTQDLTNFLAWAEENGIKWDKNAVEVREGKHGLGVYAKKNLEGGFEAIQVPKAIVLSVMSTGIANLLEEEETIESYVGLALAAMYETALGEESVWSAYLALLSSRVPAMASDLPEDARELMKKCEAYADIEADLKDMRTSYDTIVVPFIEKHPEVFTEDIKSKFFSFENFRTMTAQVSTRAMDVDDYHLSAFVPFVDLINHSSEPNAEHLAHEDVCEICGALSCEHMEESESDIEDVEEVPELAQENRAKRAAAKKADAAAPKETEEDDDEEDGDWEDEDPDNTCDIVLDEDVKKGEEITRSYGPFPNKIFLSKYGFAEIGNADDTVTIQLDMIRKAADGILNNAALVEKRVNWFLETEDIFIGESDDEDSDDEEEHEGGCCDHDHGDGHEHVHEHEHAVKEAMAEVDEEDEGEDSDDEEDFPRDIMYMDSDGAVDDRLLMLMNVLFMDEETFEKAQESVEVATEYFNDVFLRRDVEENGVELEEDVDDEGTETRKVELEPRSPAAREIRKNVLEAILAVIRIRADAYGVTDKTTAEDDLEALLNANLSGPLFYGGVCVQGEKQILQSGLKHYGDLLADF